MNPNDLDPESKFNFLVAQICKKLISEAALGAYTRRILQVRCYRYHKEILGIYRSSTLNDANRKIEEKLLDSRHSFKEVLRFLVLWFLSFGFFAKAFLSRKTKYTQFVILETPFSTISSSEVLLRIFSERIFPVLHLSNSTIIFTPGSLDTHGNLVSVPRVPFDVINHCSLSSADAWHFFINQISILGDFFLEYLRSPSVAYILKDFLGVPYINVLERKGLKAYIKTNSEYSDQQMWLERPDLRFEFLMIWYSVNTRYFKFKHSNTYDLYQYHLMYSKVHLTWVNWHAEWLRSLNPQCEILMTNPLNFGQGFIVHDLPKRMLVVFDVMPRENGFLDTIIASPAEYYYSLDNCGKFLTDVVRAARACGFNPVLKHKRKAHPSYAKEYQELVEILVSKGELFIVNPDTDVEFLISKSHGVISIPFTSTNYIANYLSKASAYYDPPGLIDLTDNCRDPMIPIAQSYSELLNFLGSLK